MEKTPLQHFGFDKEGQQLQVKSLNLYPCQNFSSIHYHRTILFYLVYLMHH